MPDPLGAMQFKYLPDPRDEIIRRAMEGELTPDEAEAEAERLGLLPLSREPDKANYDPMREPWWTLAMAAAWIIWRAPDAVREVWPDYSTERRAWRGPIPWRIPEESPYGEGQALLNLWHGTAQKFREVSGYHLEQGGHFALEEVLKWATLTLSAPRAIFTRGDEAQRDLWRRLQSGELIAEGIPYDGSERMPIREAEWLDLSHVHPKRGQADSFGLEGSEQPKYLSVQLRRAQVLKLWPVNGDKPPNAVTQRAKKSAAILEAVAEIWPEGVPQSLPIGERDRLIFKWFKDRERAEPVVETIRRALRGK